MLTRHAKAYSSSYSQNVSLSPVFQCPWHIKILTDKWLPHVNCYTKQWASDLGQCIL